MKGLIPISTTLQLYSSGYLSLRTTEQLNEQDANNAIIIKLFYSFLEDIPGTLDTRQENTLDRTQSVIEFTHIQAQCCMTMPSVFYF